MLYSCHSRVRQLGVTVCPQKPPRDREKFCRIRDLRGWQKRFQPPQPLKTEVRFCDLTSWFLRRICGSNRSFFTLSKNPSKSPCNPCDSWSSQDSFFVAVSFSVAFNTLSLNINENGWLRIQLIMPSWSTICLNNKWSSSCLSEKTKEASSPLYIFY